MANRRIAFAVMFLFLCGLLTALAVWFYLRDGGGENTRMADGGPSRCHEEAPIAGSKYFMIRIVDGETCRGIPLVEARTLNDHVYYTDSAGVIAFYEPGMMGQSVYFRISSHGYEFAGPEDDAGGVRLEVKAGGQATLEMKRLNIAERLYRTTGQGIYRDSVRLGLPTPIKEPVLNGQVFGQDGGLPVKYNGKLYWFWGDTGGPQLFGNFRTTGATSELPENGGLDPAMGIDFTYFTKEDGFVKSLVPSFADGAPLVWIDGLMTLKDENGRERLVANYASVEALAPPVARGLLVWDDDLEMFRKLTEFPDPADPRVPGWKPSLYEDDGQPYYLFSWNQTLPVLRVPATWEAVQDQSRYETFTPLMPGTGYAGKDTLIERDADGKAVWAWKRNTAALSQDQEKKLFQFGVLTDDDQPMLQFVDVDTGKDVYMHTSSISWNPYRKRWIMIGTQIGGSSFLGEIYYAESLTEEPGGPWKWAKKIVTHDDYTFYNPVLIDDFQKDGGREIYFHATYSKEFSGAEPTPGYDYNMIMYRLRLDDPRLGLPLGGDADE